MKALRKIILQFSRPIAGREVSPVHHAWTCQMFATDQIVKYEPP